MNSAEYTVKLRLICLRTVFILGEDFQQNY